MANQDGAERFVIIKAPELEHKNELTLLDMAFELPTLVQGQPVMQGVCERMRTLG